MPRFSVIIPLYNKEKDIRSTLESVGNQRFSDFEVIVVDDGSTDGSAAVVRSVKDNRIKLYSKENEGVALTRNFGVEKAEAAHVVFLDADDKWLPEHLSDLDKLITKFPKAKWFGTAYEKRFNDKLSVPLEAPVMNKTNWFGLVENYFGNCLVESIAWTSAICFQKQFFLQLKGFDHRITNGAGEDTDLWIRAALEAPLAFCTNISAIYNLEGSNRISLTPTRQRVFMDPDNYEAAAETDPDLKKYLDRNRYAYAIRHKIAGDQDSFNRLTKHLDPANITAKQRVLLKQPKSVLKMLFQIQEKFNKRGVRITSFR